MDDVAYVVAVLDELEARYPVDTANVFGTGCSNGAMFLYQLAADTRTGGRFAAIAPVAGLPHNGFLFEPTNPALRYINIWGDKDTYIPAACPRNGGTKSGPRCCGWFYSCIGNTTCSMASNAGFSNNATPALLASDRAGGSAVCRGYAKNAIDGAVALASVIDCVWPGPHGWPNTNGGLWPAEMLLNFFLRGNAPPPLPPTLENKLP